LQKAKEQRTASPSLATVTPGPTLRTYPEPDVGVSVAHDRWGGLVYTFVSQDSRVERNRGGSSRNATNENIGMADTCSHHLDQQLALTWLPQAYFLHLPASIVKRIVRDDRLALLSRHVSWVEGDSSSSSSVCFLILPKLPKRCWGVVRSSCCHAMKDVRSKNRKIRSEDRRRASRKRM
jgi:hypothetical protein